MLFFGPISSIFDITTFALMWYVFDANTPDPQTLFQSGWFVVGLLTQTLIVHMIRTPKIPFLQSRAAMPVMVMTACIMAVGIFLPFSPLASNIGLVPLPLSYFPVAGQNPSQLLRPHPTREARSIFATSANGCEFAMASAVSLAVAVALSAVIGFERQ